ncbi:hypothetical protein ACU5AX_02940 [Sphingomonas sp. XXL09]|uniref:hypothetical protein n=1 Tax=Sphingomonas sp. XXL09 TaxID=3457787 RepID=UPI00406BAB7A
MSNVGLVLYALLALVVIALLIWKANYLKSALKYVAKDEMPIWLSVALAVFAAVGTYYVAPLVNENFEFQKNRSAHLLSTVDELNKGVVDLAISVRKFNDALYDGGLKKSRRGDALDKIAELQWRLVAADVIIRRVYPSDTSTKDFSQALANLQNVIIEAKKPSDQDKVADAYVLTLKKARHCMVILYDAARIN